ncbi:MAG: nickel-dependent hydrogenase large subunit [Pseudomonadota bacterium]
MSTPPIRRYVLHVGGTQAQVLRSGPPDVLTVGRGKALNNGLALASLLFPICPRAHQIAALRAAENATGLVLPDGQAAAREMLLLSEGIFSAVWRAALSWAKVLHTHPPAAAVQQARQANEALAEALFQTDWACLGGAKMALNADDINSALKMLTRAFEAVDRLGEDICLKAQTIQVRRIATSTLDARAETRRNTSNPVEETPRLLLAPMQQATSLEPWLSAQLQHGANMLEELKQQASNVHEEKPASATARANGSGFGIAMTARGRLRHALTLEDGIITRWSAKAPTDWNFRPNGAACRVASALEETSEENASMLLAALDPCAPCEVVLEAAHA